MRKLERERKKEKRKNAYTPPRRSKKKNEVAAEVERE